MNKNDDFLDMRNRPLQYLASTNQASGQAHLGQDWR